MSLWQFDAVVAGYLAAHVPDEVSNGLSDAEADDLWAWMESKEGR